MRQNTRLLIGAAASLVVIALAVSVAGGGSENAADPAPTTTTTAEPTTTLAPTTTTTLTPTTTTLSPAAFRLAAIDKLADQINAEELAAQLLVVGLNGINANQRLSEVVGTACVGGIFLTESNNNWAPIESAQAVRDLVATIDAAAAGCIGPLITTDAEFGSVVRVPVESPAPAPTWTDRYINGSPFDVLVDIEQTSFDYANNLRDLGIDVNFGVVADVDTDPRNFMARSGRTFGDDPGVVASLTTGLIAGHCQAGVAATLKHFPNQGDTVEDPHRERSFATSDIATWETMGRVPYLNTNAPLVMTGHIYTELDPELPASLSHAVTTGLLREDLGYEGVVITDDLSSMRGAIDAIGDSGERAVAAVEAGADLVLFVNDNDAPPVLAALEARITNDEAFEARAREAVRRTLELHGALAEPELLPLCG